MRFGPGYESFERLPRQYGGQLKDHKVGIFVKKISLRLKKSKKFSFRNSPLTRQHNVSLNVTKSKIFNRVPRKCLVNNPTCKACQCDANIACNCKAPPCERGLF